MLRSQNGKVNVMFFIKSPEYEELLSCSRGYSGYFAGKDGVNVAASRQIGQPADVMFVACCFFFLTSLLAHNIHPPGGILPLHETPPEPTTDIKVSSKFHFSG